MVTVIGHGENDIGVPHGILWQVIGTWTNRRLDETWKQEGSKSVLKAEDTQTIRTYINKSQAMVAQCVDLWSILEVCAQEETG